MKTYETPDVQVATIAQDVAVAITMDDNLLPLSSMVPKT